MSKIVEDVKTGLKGIRGAGDVIRGDFLEATDQAFDNKNHTQTQASQSKNRAVADKGKQDLKNVDEMFARREWERKGVTSSEGTEAASTLQSARPSASHVPATTTENSNGVSGVQDTTRQASVKEK
ncbi:hypothetical protein F5Y02DRAFT_127701 [Annulohypoxylon stygium]|nr:hypothetical protein F5Y02DRAFT_127701 [Annulohypoxylon stygium]